MFEMEDDPETFAATKVRGLSPTASDEDGPALKAALGRSGVLCLRMDRPLLQDEFESVAALFGPIKDPIATTRDGEALRYSERRQTIDSGFVMTDEIREKLGDVTFGGLDDERPGLFETFHCDDTFTREPARVTVLHARNLPESGGGPTCFMDMRAAYELLGEASRKEIEGLRVAYSHNNENAFPPRRAASGPADVLEDVAHPLVRTHPLAGNRALFLDLDRATHIESMPVADGRGLIQRLQDHSEAKAPRCEHEWQKNDVLVWDNASVQHKASGNFKLGESRRFWRHMVSSERPV